MERDQLIYVSPNRLEGRLVKTPLSVILNGCKRHLITGYIRVEALDQNGEIILRAGGVDDATWMELRGDEAVQSLCELVEGRYLLVQRLPDLTGELGDAAQAEGDLEEIPLVMIMRHCEDEALSCTITVVSDFDRGEIIYRAGEISKVKFNGKTDEDSIVEIVHFEKGRFRISAPPLPDDIKGWPSVGSEPTTPFKVKVPRPANVKCLDEIQKLGDRIKEGISSTDEVSYENEPAHPSSSSEENRLKQSRDPGRYRTSRSQPHKALSCGAVLVFLFVLLSGVVSLGLWVGLSI